MLKQAFQKHSSWARDVQHSSSQACPSSSCDAATSAAALATTATPVAVDCARIALRAMDSCEHTFPTEGRDEYKRWRSQRMHCENEDGAMKIIAVGLGYADLTEVPMEYAERSSACHGFGAK